MEEKRVGDCDQKEAEALVIWLLKAFVAEGDGLASRYLEWVKKQPLPRPKCAICCVLGSNDMVNDAEKLPWVAVPEDGKCPWPIDWTLCTDPDTQLLVFVQVALGSTKSVKGHAIHTIG